MKIRKNLLASLIFLILGMGLIINYSINNAKALTALGEPESEETQMDNCFSNLNLI